MADRSILYGFLFNLLLLLALNGIFFVEIKKTDSIFLSDGIRLAGLQAGSFIDQSHSDS